MPGAFSNQVELPDWKTRKTIILEQSIRCNKIDCSSGKSLSVHGNIPESCV